MHPTETERPIRYGMRYPARIRAEYDAMSGDYWLMFDGSDGSQIRVGLSYEQKNALVGMGSRDPVNMARDLYVNGCIDVDEFEHRLNRFSHSGGGNAAE